MRSRFFISILVALATLFPASASAGPTRWDVGVGFGYGGFAVDGDFAADNHAEGGGLLRAPLHVRLFDWEVVGDLMAGRGAAESASFDDFELMSWGLQARRYLTLGYRHDRDAELLLEGYLAAAARHLDLGPGDRGRQWGYGYGAGLQVRFRAGRKAVRSSMSLWMEFERVYTAAGDSGVGGSQIQSISFGLTLLGLGR